jgi:cell division control protein 24
MSTIAGRKKSIISTSGVSIDQPVANKTLLNQAASESLYQQCSRLRARLLQIPSFVPYFALAAPPETVRQSTDPVTQLGVPLVALYNLMFGDSEEDELAKIAFSTAPEIFDATNDKLKKRAIALFSMKARETFPNYEMFNITELVGARETSDGFTKVR